MAQDEDFLDVGRDPDPQQPAQRRDGLRVQGAGAAEPLVGRRRRLRERLADLHAIQLRMINRADGAERPTSSGPSPADEQVIVVAHELSPGLTVQLDREHVVGLVSEEGHSHRRTRPSWRTRSGIPAVMGVVGALARIPDGDHGAARRTERHDRARPDPRRAGGGQDPDQPPAPPRAPARRRRGSAGGHARRAADPAAWATWTCPRRSSRPMRLGRAGRRACSAPSSCSPGAPPCPPRTSRPSTSAGSRLAFPEHTVIIRSFDLGGDKFPAAFKAAAGGQPVPRAGARSASAWTSRRCSGRRCAPCCAAAADRDIQLMLPLVTRVDEVSEARAIVRGGGARIRQARACARRRRCRSAS